MNGMCYTLCLCLLINDYLIEVRNIDIKMNTRSLLHVPSTFFRDSQNDIRGCVTQQLRTELSNCSAYCI